MRKSLAVLVLPFVVSAVLAADPPTLVNYQGVLRDAADKPRAGTFDMVFRFFDAATAGNEILVDSHTGGGGNAVTVSGGLFNVQLGGGTVTDGSGAGTYTSLDQVFRDYGATYLQITVGAETLSPRVRIQSAAYALNASNLQGKPASGFVDTTSSTQTKAGHLVISDGLEGNSSSAVGVQGIGAQSGGTFANQAITAVAHLGYNFGGGQYAVHGKGNTAGGWFEDNGGTSYAKLGQAGYGLTSWGTQSGGYFSDNGFDNASLASGGFGISTYGSDTGVSGSGNNYGASFFNGGNRAYLATTTNGIDAYGQFQGGSFHNSNGSGQATLSTGDYGLIASATFVGGYFYDADNSGYAYLGYGDLGIDGHGAQAGGHFAKPVTNAQSYLAASNGFTENGVYGLSYGTNESPGYFIDNWYGSYAYVGQGGYKIWGSGSVSFVQNDPTDASRVIVYTAPEGDEVAVYTRGTARLVGGVATIALGETFRSVANPDTGLTAQLTPHGVAVPLAVESVSTSTLVVRGPAGGPQDVVFDYAVWGLRIGFENRPVMRPKLQESFIPSSQPDEELLAAKPQLAAFTAKSRFARMESAVDTTRAPKSYAASDSLRAAIHMYDRDVDLPAMTAKNSTDAAVAPRQEPPTPTGAAVGVQAERSAPRPTAAIPTPTGPASPAYPPNTSLAPLGEAVQAGDVLANDAARPGELRRAVTAADPGVVGIVAGEPGAIWNGSAPLALAGAVVVCKVDATYGAIAANDLLVASPTIGHAMRAGDSPKQGTVVGKALEPWEAGTGTIRVLVMAR